MRILGIDPGSRLTGFAVIETHGDRLRACGFGVIRTGSGELPQRLAAIFEGVERVVAEMAPEALAIESVFMARNAQSALKLGQARGAAICAATRTGLAVYEYAPRAVKLAVVGSGRAEKGQIQHMMQQILQIEESLQADAADALAVAVCHAHTQHTRGYASRQLAALAFR
ncbi:MAG: crossover junction endodeoxyribonuclease RuvC [Thioalkalivibrio sp.]|nr:crossover junction endodeoxyribonuclease RuvC [Thioalkalivibrio sp.]